MNIKRLQRLAAVLQTVHEQNSEMFDLNCWFFDYARPTDCQTSACALGWAARDAELQAEGLEIDSYGGITYCQGDEKRTYCGAAIRFFGLEGRAAMWLFGPNEYKQKNPTALDVKDRVEQLLATATQKASSTAGSFSCP